MDFNFNLDLSFAEEKKIKELNEKEIYDVFIIGGGPAALTAAVYCMRKGVNTAIVASKIGGQVADTKGIENYMGYNYIEGDELVSKFSTQVKQFEISYKDEIWVEEVFVENNIKKIRLSNGKVYQSKTVVIAAGSKWRQLNVPGEKELKGRGVAYCAICDGPFFKDLDIAIVGGGNTGVESALDLAKTVKSITLVEYAEKLNADKVLVDKIANFDNIKVITNAKVMEILGDNAVNGLKYQDRSTLEEHTVGVEGVFVEIGLEPNTSFVKDLLELNKYKEIITNKSGETSVSGIFAAGDITDVPFKQIIIASGEGAKAALAACEYLLKN